MQRKTTRPVAARTTRGAQRDSTDGLQSLQTAFRILDALTKARGPVALTELAATLGELKPRIHRHLATMKNLGVIFQDARNGRYGLGGRLFSLGEAALDQYDLRFVADPYLTQLRDETRLTALLSVPANGEPIVLSCVEYRDKLTISSRPGNRPPPHCSSQGRVALAFADEAARTRLLGRKLVAFTPRSLTDRQVVEARLPIIRKRFFEEASDEIRLGINTVSAPVFRDAGELVGIVGIVGTSAEIGSPPARQLIETLHRIAGALSAQLNCRIYYERGFIK